LAQAENRRVVDYFSCHYSAMGKQPKSAWGLRAKSAGLDQKTLARLAGTSPNTVYRGLSGTWGSGVPGYLVSLIVAWEMLTEDQRRALLDASEEKGSPDERR
jgi:hypothetical protein